MSDTIIMYENGKAVGGEGHPTNADEITFNNEDTDLVSEEVESAIKEVNGKFDRGSVSVTADGVKTYGALFNELFALVDFSKINANSMLQYGSGEVCVCRLISPTAIYFENTNVEANSFTAAKVVLNENASMIVTLSITYSPLAATPTDFSAIVPVANTVFTICY